jgi:hypothetical protein
MNEYNSMPENAAEISKYDDLQRFFMYCLTEESREPNYDKNNFMLGSFKLKIFWVNKDRCLGFGIADDWKASEIKWYRFGSEENWRTFERGFGAQFSRDNS